MKIIVVVKVLPIADDVGNSEGHRKDNKAYSGEAVDWILQHP